MKKLFLAVTIIILILTTAVIKNTTKKIEDKIFAYKESLRLLKSDFENPRSVNCLEIVEVSEKFNLHPRV